MPYKFNPLVTTINDLRDIVEGAASYGIEPNDKVAHGLKLFETLQIQKVTHIPAVNLLELTEDQVIEHTYRIASIRASAAPGQPAINMAADNMQQQVVKETAEALNEDAPRIIEELRPTFDTAAKYLVRAINAGITPNSTAQDVLDLGSSEAATIWNELPAQYKALDRIKGLRVKLSRTLGMPPQVPHYGADPVIDYTRCFVHPDTGITTGAITSYPNNATGRTVYNTPQQEWLYLATITNGNMELN